MVHLVVGVCLSLGLEAPRYYDLPSPAARTLYCENHIFII
ncbi:hypothetical protein BSNK01_09510 [Bacillaceae bacterium]